MRRANERTRQRTTVSVLLTHAQNKRGQIWTMETSTKVRVVMRLYTMQIEVKIEVEVEVDNKAKERGWKTTILKSERSEGGVGSRDDIIWVRNNIVKIGVSIFQMSK
jgi:hypothetical protein